MTSSPSPYNSRSSVGLWSLVTLPGTDYEARTIYRYVGTATKVLRDHVFLTENKRDVMPILQVSTIKQAYTVRTFYTGTRTGSVSSGFLAKALLTYVPRPQLSKADREGLIETDLKSLREKSGKYFQKDTWLDEAIDVILAHSFFYLR